MTEKIDEVNMTEKEFASWFRENIPKEGLSENTTFSKQFVHDAWNNGYSNGYDKANKWHSVKDGDLPKDNNNVLVLLKDKTVQVDYYFSKIGWNISVNADVIAWKEITLPKEN